MLKVFSGKVFKTPRGSFRSLRISSPVLVIVVVTFKFSNPSTLKSGIEALRVRPGVAETTTAEATRVRREARMEGENIVVKVVKAVETLGPKGPGLSSLPVLPISQSSFPSRWVNQPGSTALPENNCYETKFGRHHKAASRVSRR